MKTVWTVLRYSGVGVFCAGMIGVIQGCSIEREGALFAVLLLMLNFCTPPVEQEEPMATPIKIPEIVLFSAGQPANQGDLMTAGGGADGREGADNLCVAAKPAGLTQSNVRAFISVKSGDAIIDMPTKYGVPEDLPIVGPTRIAIADDWPDLFDHNTDALINSLRDAGVTNATGNEWWTGSNSNGNARSPSDLCNVWTSNTSGTQGGVGREAVVNFNWLDNASNRCNTTTNELICIGF